MSDYFATALTAYLATVVWSTTDDDGEPVKDDITIDPSARDAAETYFRDFFDAATESHPEILTTIDAGQFGQDFALTSAHHGTGFWDRGLGALGDALTAQAHGYGTDWYVGDDGALYSTDGDSLRAHRATPCNCH